MDIETKLAAALQRMLFILQSYAPRKTGNLQENAVRLDSLGGGVWKLYVDMEIAPYMPFTNEPWTSPNWNGRKNPNEGWFDRAMEVIVRYIASAVGGDLRRIG